MPRAPAQRGDFTGQERQRLAEEKAKELADRQKEIGLVNQVDVVYEEEGVWDPATGDVVEMSEEAQAKIEALSEPVEVEADPILDPSLKVPGYDPMKDLQDIQTQQRTKPQMSNVLEVQDLGPEPVVVEDEWRVIRVNTDIEEMTYGAGNTLTFLRGRRYRVPRDLYNWLESRGVVYH
jgi:hypothetical protein